MSNSEFGQVFERSFRPVGLLPVSPFMETPRGPRIVIRGPVSKAEMNEQIGRRGMVRIIPGTDGKLGLIALDAPVAIGDLVISDCRVVVNLDEETVDWESSYPDFLDASGGPKPIGIVRVTACVGSSDPMGSNAEIMYLLEQISNAVKTIDVPNGDHITHILTQSTSGLPTYIPIDNPGNNS